MKQDFLDELMEALQALKEEQKTLVLPAPVPPHKVIRTIQNVAKNHELTFEEKRTMATMAMAMDGLTAEEAEILRRLEKGEE